VSATSKYPAPIGRPGLDGAVRDGLIVKNPAVLVTRPGMARREAKHLDGNSVAAVLKAAEASRYHSALVLIAATGLRKGEALALSWDKSIVNLDENWLKVHNTVGRVGKAPVFSEPKTERWRRTVPLSPGVVATVTQAQSGPGRRATAGR
jgi:integrase